MVNSKRKGAAGERELARELTRIFGVKVRRGQQFSGIEGRDVVGIPGVHVECKRVERLNLQDAMDQSVRDADADDVPIVCHRRNLGEWLLTVRLEDVPEFVAVLESLSRDDR